MGVVALFLGHPVELSRGALAGAPGQRISGRFCGPPPTTKSTFESAKEGVRFKKSTRTMLDRESRAQLLFCYRNGLLVHEHL